MADLTPMRQQYQQIKEQYKDCILFFRLGDFYEMFEDDAKIASQELELTLTTRDRGKENPEERVPMCGVPYHASEAYIARLIAKGYKVAICEQTEDPALAKGLVSRDVIRVVTPGTLIESSMLDEGKNNFISAVYMEESAAGLCFCDISTGEVFVTGFAGEETLGHVQNELGRFSPREAVLSAGAMKNDRLTGFLREQLGCRCESGREACFEEEEARRLASNQFPEDKIEELLLSGAAAVRAVGGLLSYLYETQKTDLSYLCTLLCYGEGQFMELDLSVRRNLEITESLRNKEKKGSLLWVLDRTKTPMGRRLIRGWIVRPLLGPVPIRRRLEAVGELVDQPIRREELALALRDITDLERLIGKVVYGTVNGRDLKALSAGCAKLPVLIELLAPFASSLLRETCARIDPLADLCEKVDRAIADDPPFSIREGGVIRDGYHAEVDALRAVQANGRDMIAGIEASEREKTGIKNLKVGYNRVFGYYIEISKSNYDLVPEHYIRKQTLANCERFITQELKEMENTILTARERLETLEYELFSELRACVAAMVGRVQRTAAAVAQLDVLVSFAAVASANGYAMPQVDLSDVIEITQGRHPVVEQTLSGSMFVPNDTHMDCGENRLAIITGPNMAGKSTYMRQVALIVLMAQIGSFVPAKHARIGIVDQIFTRIGASDDLASGQSTFMVEMTEIADILKHATAKSLLILDEVGRGTSTYDGMSIARAVLEYCASRRRLGAKTLFATHYHELTALEGELPGALNFNIAVKKRGDDVIFLRKIVRGGADRSYGVEVARLAGVPDQVIARARELLAELEENRLGPAPVRAPSGEEAQISLRDLGAEEAAARLRAVDINTLTPIEAMNLIYELKLLLQG